MKHEDELRQFLQQMTRALKGHKLPDRHYPTLYHFLLKHGEGFAVEPLPAGIRYGAPRCCFGNTLMGAVKYGWRYVEGFAMPPTVKFPVHHAWSLDQHGNAYDLTWREPGVAYIGVEFSIGRADDCTWNGDSCVLDDWKRHWPILKDEWHGEDFGRIWPPSEAMQLALAMLARKAVHA
jgi:hypothetical protein